VGIGLVRLNDAASHQAYRHGLKVVGGVDGDGICEHLLLRLVSAFLLVLSEAQERVLALRHRVNLRRVELLALSELDLLGPVALGRGALELHLISKHFGFLHNLHLCVVFL